MKTSKSFENIMMVLLVAYLACGVFIFTCFWALEGVRVFADL